MFCTCLFKLLNEGFGVDEVSEGGDDEGEKFFSWVCGLGV